MPHNFLVEPELNMKPLLRIALTFLALILPQSIIAAEDKVKTNTLTSYFKDIRPITGLNYLNLDENQSSCYSANLRSIRT